MQCKYMNVQFFIILQALFTAENCGTYIDRSSMYTCTIVTQCRVTLESVTVYYKYRCNDIMK